MMKRLAAAAICLAVTIGSAGAAGPVTVAGRELSRATEARLYGDTTYVSVRAVAEALEPAARVEWRDSKALVERDGLHLAAEPGAPYIEVNTRVLYVQRGVLLESGRTMAPVRVLAEAMGASVEWDPATGAVTVTKTGPCADGSQHYDAESLHWLSRIISAEAQGEPLSGKIAVGNVIMNRVDSPDFPDTVYGVIFDSRWGGQFTPVRNGAIYNEPTEESVLAAKLVLEGASVAGDSLYFLAPALAQNFWIMQNRPWRITIGAHSFYA